MNVRWMETVRTNFDFNRGGGVIWAKMYLQGRPRVLTSEIRFACMAFRESYTLYIQSAAKCLSNVALLYNPVVPKRGPARRKGRISGKEKQLATFAPFGPDCREL
jgi:hypothetical protein